MLTVHHKSFKESACQGLNFRDAQEVLKCKFEGCTFGKLSYPQIPREGDPC